MSIPDRHDWIKRHDRSDIRASAEYFVSTQLQSAFSLYHCRVLAVWVGLWPSSPHCSPERATRTASDTIFCTVVGSRASKVPYEHCRVVAVSGSFGRLRRACNCRVEACDSTGVSGLSPYVAAVAAGCLGMPSTRCSASHRATDSYTAATARPPALRHEHTSPFPPPSLRSRSRSVWMHGRAS